MTTCTNPVAASNAKLALFYDWLFFDPEKVFYLGTFDEREGGEVDLTLYILVLYKKKSSKMMILFYFSSRTPMVNSKINKIFPPLM